MKLLVSQFAKLPVGQRFVSLATYDLTHNVFRKTEDIASSKRWSIHSNAVQLNKNMPVHFEAHVIVVPEGEFHKIGIE